MKTLRAQRFRGAKPRQRRTHDHDPSLGLKGINQVGHQRMRWSCPLPRVRGCMLHQDGLHRARRRSPQYPLALRLIGVGS